MKTAKTHRKKLLSLLSRAALTVLLPLAVAAAGIYYISNSDHFENIESIQEELKSDLQTTQIEDSGFGIESAASMMPAAGDTLIPSGSLIIDMGVSPQTWENGVKPYGMIFDLIKNNKIPIIWSINPNKLSNKNIGVDDVDFSYNGQDFKGGPFIIMAQYRTGNVNSTITQWENKGVVTVETTSDVVVPVFEVLRNVPNWTLDFANGNKLIPGFDQAEIPEFSDPQETDVNYIFKTPDQLTCCDYVFAMPHADPEWSTHGDLYNWVLDDNVGGCRGWIYSACHAVSALENSFDDQTPDVATQMNFLSDKTADADISMSPWAENSLVIWGDHGDGDGDYIYDQSTSADPFMQFIGTMGNAMEGGSEQIYMPYLATSWRSTTRVPIYDSDHPDIGGIANSRAAKLAYGPAFGNGNYNDYTQGNGWAMYMGGHEISGNEISEVSAYRSFFNFSFMAALSRGGDITYFDTIPSQIERNKTIPVSASASGGSPDYTFTWEVDPPIGSFSVNNIVAGEGVVVNTQYTAPHVTAPVQVVISLTISDQCITRTIQSYATIIVPDPL